jgi:hypothetical protein
MCHRPTPSITETYKPLQNPALSCKRFQLRLQTEIMGCAAGLSAFFGILGMTAILAAIAAAELVTAAWLTRHWREAPLLRAPLIETCEYECAGRTDGGGASRSALPWDAAKAKPGLKREGGCRRDGDRRK